MIHARYFGYLGVLLLARIVPVLDGLFTALVGANYVADGRLFDIGGVEI